MHFFITTTCGIIALILVVFAFGVSADPATEKPATQELHIAIQGYSPVSYFGRNIAEKGSPEFAIEQDGKFYHLTSLQQADVFRENPRQYIPFFAALCSYSLTLGRQVAIDPTHYKIIGSQLLLFHRSSEMDGLKQWNDNGSNQELLENANQEFFLIKF